MATMRNGAPQIRGNGWYQTIVCLHPPHVVSQLNISDIVVSIHPPHTFNGLNTSGGTPETNRYGWCDVIVSLHPPHVFNGLVVSGSNFDPANQYYVIYEGTIVAFTRRHL